MKTTLPPGVEVMVRLVVPRASADDIVIDLAEDFARVRSSGRRGGAVWWLVREAASLSTAYMLAPFRRVKDNRSIWQRDVTLVIRGLRRGLVPATGAAAMLSAGLLAMLLTAGLAETLLFRSVSATHGERLRRVTAIDRQGRASLRLSFVELQEIRRHVDGAASVTTANLQPVVMRASGSDLQTMAEVVDGQYFSLTGTQTIIGRGLIGTDDQPTTTPLTVLSEPLWRRRFDANPSVLGQTLHLNGAPFVVVGIARALGSSSFLGASVDAWVTSAHADAVLNSGWRTNISDRWFIAFVLPTTTAAEVDARLTTAATELARGYPDAWRDRRLQTSAGTVLTGSQRTNVMMLVSILAGLGVLILATAASNVGGVLLARAAAARRQVAIHLSIGSGRAAVVRRQLIEGALLGLAGAVMAIGLYVWARNWLGEIALLPTLALRLDLPLDLMLVAGVAGVGTVAGIALAAGPALWMSRVELSSAMFDADSRSIGGRGVTRLRRLLVAAQVCLSLTLIVGAALFTRSLSGLTTADLGFTRDRLIAMDFDLEPAGPLSRDLPALAREALARAETTPGVIAAAMSNRAPVDQSTPSTEVRASATDGTAVTDVTVYLATERYFETVGIPIVAGRSFTATEANAESDVVIVNETLAARLWPDGDALDRPLYLVTDAKTLRIVGVARNSKYRSISEPPRPHIYRPIPPGISRTLLARTSGEPRETLRALQRTLDRVGPGLVGFFPRTLDDHLAIDLLPTRAAAAAASAVGSLALLLSAVGLYGLVSWFVELRRREIGVRMALGANAADVRRLVVRQALSTALPGMIAGVVLSAALGFLSRAALFGVGPIDPAALAAGIGMLAAVVVAAAYVPSRRATRVDPAGALRP